MKSGGWCHRVFVTLRALLVCVLVAMPLRAQVPGEELARRAFDEGVELERRGDYAAALEKFRKSVAIKPTVGNRFHVAFCLEMTGQLASALNEYEAVVKLAQEQKKADVVEQTRARMDPLRPRVPQIALSIAAPAPPHAEVFLDGKPVAPALLDGEPFRIDPGEHTIDARAPERAPFERRLTIAEGSSTSLEIALPPSAPVASSARTARPMSFSEPPKDEPRPRTAAIVTTVGTVLLAGGGAVAYVIADRTHEEAERTCPTRRSCTEEREKVRFFDALALGGFAGAAGLAALSVLLWTSKPVFSAHAPVTSVALRPAPSGLRLEGAF
jgi:hypothetical protein